MARIKAEETAAEGRIARPVAGFDLTFSVPKSVSTVWALADSSTQALIHAAHRDAIQASLSWAAEQVFFSRTGAGGAVQEPVRGVVAARFDHWNSRAGDPHLHTPVVVANRAQTADGQWRTLDSRTLHKYVVAMSELHEGVLQDLLTERLGYGWSERARRHSPVPRHDIAGVPAELLEGVQPTGPTDRDRQDPARRRLRRHPRTKTEQRRSVTAAAAGPTRPTPRQDLPTHNESALVRRSRRDVDRRDGDV